MTRLFCVLLAVAASGGSLAAGDFDRYFTDSTLRVDYYHSGTKGVESFSLDRVSMGGPWAGSRVNLLDTLNLGEFIVRVYDRASASLVYSRGFSSMFNEWQTTDEAVAGIQRTFHESALIPLPKKPVQFTIGRRDRQMDYRELFPR